MAGTDNEEWIETCKKYGYHLNKVLVPKIVHYGHTFKEQT
jgi:hypothetical protein